MPEIFFIVQQIETQEKIVNMLSRIFQYHIEKLFLDLDYQLMIGKNSHKIQFLLLQLLLVYNLTLVKIYYVVDIGDHRISSSVQLVKVRFEFKPADDAPTIFADMLFC